MKSRMTPLIREQITTEDRQVTTYSTVHRQQLFLIFRVQRPLALVFFFLSFFIRRTASLCLHVANNSLREFRLARSELKIISYFSDIHKLQTPVTGENGAARPIISNFTSFRTSKFGFSSFNSHTRVDKVVEFW